MYACPAYLTTLVGLVGGLICRLVAFLPLHIRVSGLGMIPAMLSETRVLIVAFAARLLALAHLGAVGGACAAGTTRCDTRGSLRDALVVGSVASGRLATLIDASPHSGRKDCVAGARFGVTLPAGTFGLRTNPRPRRGRRAARQLATVRDRRAAARREARETVGRSHLAAEHGLVHGR